MVIASGERLREFLRQAVERQAYIFRPPHRLQTPSLPLLIARGALEDDGDESVTESFAPLGATSLVASRHPPTRSF